MENQIVSENNNSLTPDVLDDDRITSLVDEFSFQRNSLNDMIVDLEKIKDKIETLFPDKMDKRYVRFFEEKMKAMTSLFGTILDIRKEIMKGLKTEVELRKSITSGQDSDDIPEGFDVRKMAEKLDRLNDKMNQQKDKRRSLRTKGQDYVKLDN